MAHLRKLPIFVLALAIAACAETPTNPHYSAADAAFDGTSPPPDNTGRGVYFGGGH